MELSNRDSRTLDGEIGMEAPAPQPRAEGGWIGSLKQSLRRRHGTGFQLGEDLLALSVALLFAMCPLTFGSHPLAIALLAVLPDRVWSAALGAVIGALCLGQSGIVYAMIAVLVVFLRIMISGGPVSRAESDGASVSPCRRPLFSEGLPLRVAAAVIGGFVAALYELLLTGLSLASVMFGAATVVFAAALVIGFYGLFDAEIGFADFLVGRRNLFAVGMRGRALYASIYFRISCLIFIFFLSFSLRSFSFFGVDLAYVFATLLTLFAAKRFGPLYGMVAGFVATVGLSPLYAVAFALAGVGAGALFGVGIPYALLAGGAVLTGFSAYAGGVVGLLGTLPEYVLGALLILPLARHLASESRPRAGESAERLATDMVGTMALAYRNRRDGALDGLESAFSSLSPMIRRFGARDGVPSREEYRLLAANALQGWSYAPVAGPSREALTDFLQERLVRRESIFPADLGGDVPEEEAKAFLSRLGGEVALAEEEKYRARRMDFVAEDYELIAKLINEARASGERARLMDESLTEALETVFLDAGFAGGVIRAFGERRTYVLAAGEDRTGTRITSPALMSALEQTAGVSFGTPAYYRRGDMVLAEMTAQRRYAVETAYATMAGESGEISGDTVSTFDTADDYFYALLSDGMGSGRVAKETSAFVADFLSGILGTGISRTTALHLLHHIVRRRGEDCAATVDLLEFDLLRGEASMVKSGAAPTYVKRGDRIFRLRSQTVPLGLSRELDAERLRVELAGEDVVVMLSDGVSQSGDDTPWLFDILNRPLRRGVKEYADAILTAAVRHTSHRDDMSVLVARVQKLR